MGHFYSAYILIESTLSSLSSKSKMALCGNNRRMWRFLLKYLITVQHTRLYLEQRPKRWTTVSPSKLQNEQSEILCLQNKKGFD